MKLLYRIFSLIHPLKSQRRFFKHLFKNKIIIENGNTLIFPGKKSFEKYKTLRKTHILIKGKNNILQINPDIDPNTTLFIEIYGNNNTVHIKTDKLCNIYMLIGDKNSPVNSASVVIGERTSLNEVNMRLLEDHSSIKIGSDCMFSTGIFIWCTDCHCILDQNNKLINKGHSIEIGDHCWVGMNTLISKNTVLSNNTIVGWGSIVTRQFLQENVIIAGNPARIVKTNVKWDKCSPNKFIREMK